MKGANVFSGYFKREDKTSEAFDEDGWFRSGDVAMVYPNGSVRIIDRSKNIFKLSQGEYIAPEKLENIFVLSPLIAQSMVYGDSLKNCCVAIVVPDPDGVKAWAAEHHKAGSPADLINDPELNKAIVTEMHSLCVKNKCSSLEKPQEIYLTLDAFTVENDILTPTFKLKRNVGKKIYQAQIDAMYVELEKRGR